MEIDDLRDSFVAPLVVFLKMFFSHLLLLLCLFGSPFIFVAVVLVRLFLFLAFSSMAFSVLTLWAFPPPAPFCFPNTGITNLCGIRGPKTGPQSEAKQGDGVMALRSCCSMGVISIMVVLAALRH